MDEDGEESDLVEHELAWLANNGICSLEQNDDVHAQSDDVWEPHRIVEIAESLAI